MIELLGSARVSTSDQSPDSQADALTAEGCGRVRTDVASGVHARRPALTQLVATAAAGDTVVVCRLDRLGRSLPDLLSLIQDLTERKVGLRSLAEHIDTTSATGRLVLHVFGALAEFERALMHERTMAGLVAARARGRRGGRPRALTAAQRPTPKKWQPVAHRYVKSPRSWARAGLLSTGRYKTPASQKQCR